MKKQNKYILIIFVVTVIISCTVNFCRGQSREDEIVYYNNPDIISNRLADNNESSHKSGIESKKNAEITFAEVEEAKKLLTAKDDFIKSLSSFDRSARLKTDKPVSEKEFLEYIANQVRPWTVAETVRLRAVIKSIAKRFKEFDLNFPQKIYLIKTTGAEEGGAAYCRSNAIILPEQMLKQQNPDLEKLLIHELSHVLLSNNAKLKESLYEAINFKKCNEIELPQKLREIKITNPDGVKNDHYIEVKYENADIQVVPIIYSSSSKYNVARGGEFFRYLRVNLLAVEKDGEKWLYKRDNAGEPVLFELREMPDYYTKIGSNTQYVIHPDEIVAENFVLLVLGTKPVKSERVIEKMRKLLQNKVEAGIGLN